jgi:basic membrane protein A
MHRERRQVALVRCLLVLLITALSLGMLAACGGSDDSGASNGAGGSGTDTSASEEESPDLRVAVIANQDSGDDATVDGMLNGMKQGEEELGYEAKSVIVLDPNQYEPTLRALAEEGNPLIIGAVQGLGPAFDAVAPDFPDTQFAIFFAEVDQPNVSYFFAPQNEMAFPGGLAAGLMTKTDTVAFIGGLEHPIIRDTQAGFIHGATLTNPDVKVLENYPNTLDDPAKGQEVARALFGQGADVVSSLAVHTSLGAYEYAKTLRDEGEETWAVSFDAQHISRYAGDAALVSTVFRLDKAVYAIMEDFENGALEPGLHEMTLDNGQIGVFEWGPQVPEDVQAEVEEYVAQVGSGEIEVADHEDIPQYREDGILE